NAEEPAAEVVEGRGLAKGNLPERNVRRTQSRESTPSALEYYDAVHGLDWRWQSADTSRHKAPLGGEKNGAQPHRPRQEWHQAPYAHRRGRRPRRSADHAGQLA